MKTARCLGLVESSYRSKKEGLGTAALPVGLLKPVSVCLSGLQLSPTGGGTQSSRRKDTLIFQSNEHLHRLTSFLEFRI